MPYAMTLINYLSSFTDMIDKAGQFSQSSDLREVMQKAGVVDQPDMHFLEALEEIPV